MKLSKTVKEKLFTAKWRLTNLGKVKSFTAIKNIEKQSEIRELFILQGIKRWAK